MAFTTLDDFVINKLEYPYDRMTLPDIGTKIGGEESFWPAITKIKDVLQSNSLAEHISEDTPMFRNEHWRRAPSPWDNADLVAARVIAYYLTKTVRRYLPSEMDMTARQIWNQLHMEFLRPANEIMLDLKKLQITREMDPSAYKVEFQALVDEYKYSEALVSIDRQMNRHLSVMFLAGLAGEERLVPYVHDTMAKPSSTLEQVLLEFDHACESINVCAG